MYFAKIIKIYAEFKKKCVTLKIQISSEFYFLLFNLFDLPLKNHNPKNS